HSCLHRQRSKVGETICGQESSYHWGRYQSADGGDYCTPNDGGSFPEAWRETRSHISTKHRREHRLSKYAQSHPPGIEENLQDRSRPIGDRPTPGGRKYSHWPERLRAMATTKKDCFHSRGRPPLWRCADGNRRETFRRRFAKLSRRGHRRYPLLQACAGPPHWWPVAFALCLFLQTSARPNDRRRSLSLRRAIHSRRTRELIAATSPSGGRSRTRSHSCASSS